MPYTAQRCGRHNDGYLAPGRTVSTLDQLNTSVRMRASAWKTDWTRSWNQDALVGVPNSILVEQVVPASTGMTRPVIQRASSLARKRTAAAQS